MDVLKVIERRKSIREFDSGKEVPKEILEDILRYGTLAPSGKNRQPWHFVVIQVPSIKNEIADILRDKAENLKLNGDYHGSHIKTSEIMREAPVFIAVLNTWNDEIINSNLQSIGACIQNICIAATAYRIGSLWICDIDIVFKEIEKLLGISDMSLVAGISLGYQKEFPDARPRKAVSEVTTWL